MDRMINDFGRFIDNLRKSRNITRESFIDGIMSIRQYQRYVNGESSLNNEKLFKLIDNLGMNFLNVHKLYILRATEEGPRLRIIYKEIVSENYKLAKEMISKISIDDFNDEYNKSFFELCNLLLARRLKTMPSNLIVDKLKKLIGYPKCMKNKIISFVEYISYLDISSNSLDNGDDIIILNFLYDKIKGNNITSDSLNSLYLPSTYAHVSQRLGVIKEYKKSLLIAQKGIDFCVKCDSLNSLSHLFFYKALSLRLLDRNPESIIAAKKSFNLLDIENKEHKTKSFIRIFEKSFNMKIDEL